MAGLDPWVFEAVTAYAFVGVGMSLAHLLRARGLRRALLFAGLRHGVYPSSASILLRTC